MTPARKQLTSSLDEFKAQIARPGPVDPKVMQAMVRLVDIHAARVIAEQDRAQMDRALGGGR